VVETLVVLAGRPSLGKSSVGAALAYNAVKAGKRTDFYTLDMTVPNLAHRLASIETRVPYKRMQWGRINETEFTTLTEVSISQSKLPLSIITHPGITLTALGAEIAKSKMRNPDLFLVVIDQLSQLHMDGKYVNNRAAEVSAITAGLKALSGRYKICIVLLHQVNREADKREGNRPHLSDLRDSGSLEQDANVVLLLAREDYYLKNDMPKAGTTEFIEWQDKMNACTGLMDIIVAKNSLGGTGTAKVRCDLPINSITDIDLNLEMF
jgi:replicative DNA helicase